MKREDLDLKQRIEVRLVTLDKWLKQMEHLIETFNLSKPQLNKFSYLSLRATALIGEIKEFGAERLNIDITPYAERYERLDAMMEQKYEPLIPKRETYDEDSKKRIESGLLRLCSAIEVENNAGEKIS